MIFVLLSETDAHRFGGTLRELWFRRGMFEIQAITLP
jgi:hypothetical protein